MAIIDVMCGRCGRCHLCWLWHNLPGYRERWGGPQPPGPGRQHVHMPAAAPCRTMPHHAAQRRTLPCVHQGGEVRRQTCPSCQGHVELKVLACALHHECTQARPLTGLACCATCPDYAPATVVP